VSGTGFMAPGVEMAGGLIEGLSLRRPSSAPMRDPWVATGAINATEGGAAAWPRLQAGFCGAPSSCARAFFSGWDRKDVAMPCLRTARGSAVPELGFGRLAIDLGGQVRIQTRARDDLENRRSRIRKGLSRAVPS